MKMRFTDNDPTAPYLENANQRRFPASPGPAFSDPVGVAYETSQGPWGEYWKSIRSRAKLIILGTALVASVAALYAYSMQPVYRSTATLLIESAKTKILSIEEVYSAVSQDREYYQTQVEILRSRDVALRAVIASKLWNFPQFDPRKPNKSITSRIKAFFTTSTEPPVWTGQNLAEATVGKFLGSVSVEPVRLSQLVKISFETTDKELAANMANATAQSFIEADRDARLKLNQEVTSLLQDRLSALREKLLQSEQALQAFREKEGLVNLSGTQGVAGQQLTDVAQRLLAARVKRTELESAYQQISKISNGDYSGVPAVLAQAAVNDARSRVSVAASKVDELSETLGSENSRVIQAKNELSAARRNLSNQTSAVISSMRREFLAAQETERSLSAALSSARGNVQEVNRQEFQLGVLEREMQTNKQLYELFLSRVKETSVSSNLQAAVARVVDPASVATAPVRPNKPMIITVAMILSALAGALIALLIDRLDNTLKGTAEAEHRLRQPVLASIPAISTSDSAGATRLFLDRPSSNHSEAIRAARTAVLLSSFDVVQKVVLVTSTVRGEGKTIFCTNLAFAHANTKRTLLIEADMRNPQIGARLGLPENAKGLSNLIADGAAISDCVHSIEGSPLMVMPAGDFSSNPEEILLSSRFQHAMRSLLNRVEIVLIDAPAMDAFSDALIIAPRVSSVIYVVQTMKTPMPLARRGIEKLQRAGANILGLVLTKVPERGGFQYASTEYKPVSENSPLNSRFFETRDDFDGRNRHSIVDVN